MAHELSEALRGNARALRGSNLKIFHESCADELDRLQALNAELVAALKATGAHLNECKVFPSASGLQCHVGKPSTFCAPCQSRAVLEKAESQ